MGWKKGWVNIVILLLISAYIVNGLGFQVGNVTVAAPQNASSTESGPVPVTATVASGSGGSSSSGISVPAAAAQEQTVSEPEETVEDLPAEEPAPVLLPDNPVQDQQVEIIRESPSMQRQVVYIETALLIILILALIFFALRKKKHHRK